MKNFTIQFKYSNFFVHKSLCKFCKSGPVKAYFVANRDQSQEQFSFLLKRKPTANKDFIHFESHFMTAVVSLREFKVLYLFDRDNIYERSIFIPNSKYEIDKDRISCRTECECGATSWAFTNSRRKHINNRKSLKTMNINSLTRLI